MPTRNHGGIPLTRAQDVAGKAVRVSRVGDDDLAASLKSLCDEVVFSIDSLDEAFESLLLANAPGWAKADAPPKYQTFVGASVIFGYTTPPGLRTYGLGVGFSFSGYSADPMAIIRVPQYDRGVIPGEDVRAFSIVDPHILVPDSGYVLEGVLDVTDPKYKGLLN